MKKYIISLLAIILAFGVGLISGCGYDGRYRYPCQDPENWEVPECKPPICDATGTCPIDIFGSIPNE
jgi:hypothetical protein